MAICEKKTTAPVPPPVEYVLRLSEEEASLLHLFLRNVPAGDGAKPLRDVSAALFRAKAPVSDLCLVRRGWSETDTVLLVGQR